MLEKLEEDTNKLPLKRKTTILPSAISNNNDNLQPTQIPRTLLIYYNNLFFRKIFQIKFIFKIIL